MKMDKKNKISMILSVSLCSSLIIFAAFFSAKNVYLNGERVVTVQVSNEHVEKPLATTISEPNKENKTDKKTDYSYLYDKEEFDETSILKDGARIEPPKY